MKEQLHEKYGLGIALSLVVGIVIGIGIFFKVSAVLVNAQGSAGLVVLSWLIAGIVTIISGLTIAELSTSIPESGGIVAYSKRIFGDLFGFLVGWFLCILYLPAIIAIVAYYFSVFFMQLRGVENPDIIFYITPFITLGSIYLMQISSVKGGGIMQLIGTISKLLPISLIIIFGFIMGNQNIDLNDFLKTSFENTNVNNYSIFKIIGMCLIPVMFAFDGWIFVTNVGAEIKNVKKNMPRTIIIGLGVISLVYVLFNIAVMKVIPLDTIMNNKGEEIFLTSKALFGNLGAKFILVGILVSAYIGNNGMVLVSARMPYALSIEDNFPFKKFFSKVSEHTNQPIRSLSLMILMSFVYLIMMYKSDNPDMFGDIPVAMLWGVYSMMFIGVIIFRKKEPNVERPYKVPIYPVLPIIAALVGIMVTYNAVQTNPMYILISLLVILIGVPVYYFIKKDIV